MQNATVLEHKMVNTMYILILGFCRAGKCTKHHYCCKFTKFDCL